MVDHIALGHAQQIEPVGLDHERPALAWQLRQPFDLPERLIAGDPMYFLHRLLGAAERHAPEALAEYERCFSDPEVRHATLEDYRAGASIDLRHDADSEAAGIRITAPTLVLWGDRGIVGGGADHPVDVWRTRASDPALVYGRAVAGAGHFLAQDQPADTLAALLEFLDAPATGATGSQPDG